MKRIVCAMAFAFALLCGWAADTGFVVTDQAGADEVIRERKVEKSVKVVPYVEPPRVVAPVGGSGVNAPAAAHDTVAGARCSGGRCRNVGKSVKKAVSRLRHR